MKARPQLRSHELEAWNSFSRLSSRRPLSGMGSIGSIPYIEIIAYIDLILQIDDEEYRAEMIELIEHLDGEFLKEVHEKQEATSSKNKKPSPKSPPQ